MPASGVGLIPRSRGVRGILHELDVEGSLEWQSIEVPLEPACVVDLHVRGESGWYSIEVLHEGVRCTRLGLQSGARETIRLPAGSVEIRFIQSESDPVSGDFVQRVVHRETFAAEPGTRRDVTYSAGG